MSNSNDDLNEQPTQMASAGSHEQAGEGQSTWQSQGQQGQHQAGGLGGQFAANEGETRAMPHNARASHDDEAEDDLVQTEAHVDEADDEVDDHGAVDHHDDETHHDVRTAAADAGPDDACAHAAPGDDAACSRADQYARHRRPRGSEDGRRERVSTLISRLEAR